MFQPEPTAYLQVQAGGYGGGMAHGLPEYTFEETPLGLGGGRGGYGGGVGGSSAAGAGGGSGVGAGAGSLIYTTPIFSASSSNSAIGPAPGSAYHQFHHSHSSTTTATSSPASSLYPQTQRSQQHPHSLSQSAPGLKMEPISDDLSVQEAAAREYQPNLEGPLVGNKTPSSAITEEYAKADPVYVQKTLALPQKYADYRPIQGDGNCGWRAIGFSYFETLINGGNRAQVEAEKQRVVALNSYIETVGAVSMYLFQDMADETIELFQRILDQFDDRERALAELLDTFNDAGMANSILYHLRLLASSWLKGNSETYLPFITLDSGVAGYSAEVIERPNVEIDHMGIQLLVNVLLKPAGFVLEVAYLDRSPGSQVNTYRFPEEANVQHASELGPVIHLLYRPDHYDILYPTNPNLQPASPPSALDMQQPVDLQVHRVGFSSAYEINNTPTALHYGGAELHPNPLALIPGFDSPPGLNTVLNLGTGSPISPYSPSPASPWMPTGFADPIRQVPQAPITVPTPTPPAQTNHPLRFSEYCQLPEYTGNNTWKEPTFQTSTFKNSHFNVAHYNNPNFQPEEYKPEADEYDLPLRGGSRKRGSV